MTTTATSATAVRGGSADTAAATATSEPRARAKDASIETLRGLAIVLVVGVHVIGGDAAHGLRVGDDSPFRWLVVSLQSLRMPLFTVISGYVYALRPVEPGPDRGIGGFVRGKARRVLLPFAAVSTLQFVTRALAPGVNDPAQLDELWRIYVFPVDQFWFLQAIFWCFLTVALVDGFGLAREPRRWALWLALGLAAALLVPRWTYALSLCVGYVYLLPFFLLGVGLYRFPGVLEDRRLVAVAAVLAAAGVAVQQLAWAGLVPLVEPWRHALDVGLGLCAVVVLFRFRPTWRPLARLGAYAYAIYLFHVFPAAGARIALGRIGITEPLLVFAVALAAGLAAPVVAETVLRRSRPLRRVLLGLR